MPYSLVFPRLCQLIQGGGAIQAGNLALVTVDLTLRLCNKATG